MKTPGPVPPRVHAGLATASLTLAVLANFGLWFLAAIPAIVCGHVALRRLRRAPERHGGGARAIAGLVLGYAGLVTGGIAFALIVGSLVPALRKSR